MTIGLKLGNITDEIGTGDFVHCFFSTISGNLEPDGWGTKFPALLCVLYQGELAQKDSITALDELETIETGLARLPPEKVIWDIDDRRKIPPWENNISADITNLSNYFITSTGRDLIQLVRECLEELRDTGGVLKIVKY
jgi:hypothetical protein